MFEAHPPIQWPMHPGVCDLIDTNAKAAEDTKRWNGEEQGHEIEMSTGDPTER